MAPLLSIVSDVQSFIPRDWYLWWWYRTNGIERFGGISQNIGITGHVWALFVQPAKDSRWWQLPWKIEIHSLYSGDIIFLRAPHWLLHLYMCARLLCFFIKWADNKPIQKQPSLSVGPKGHLRLWHRNFDPRHNVQHSVSDFLISTESTGPLATGISSVTMGCRSCEPLFPVAVEIHWEISWELVRNAVVGLILTLATAAAKTSGKDWILLVSCCQVLEKSRLHHMQARFGDGKQVPPNATLGPLEAFCLRSAVSHPAMSVS